MNSVIIYDLGHGGNSSINYKPNYLSSMNYMYQLEGLPPDNKIWDRYYYTNYKNNSDCGPIQDYSDLQSGQNTSEMVIGFSNGSGANLTESSQAESVGLGRSSPTPVDFNCDGDTSDATNIDLNPKNDGGSNTSTDILTDYNDWANITIFFLMKPIVVKQDLYVIFLNQIIIMKSSCIQFMIIYNQLLKNLIHQNLFSKNLIEILDWMIKYISVLLFLLIQIEIYANKPQLKGQVYSNKLVFVSKGKNSIILQFDNQF